ncbi:MAG: hypothetical protein HZB12_01720 [Candidatus Yonathbacteria bacterium]|nr:hypothetical protein [Candidatus Yonathbacteria bacterium]
MNLHPLIVHFPIGLPATYSVLEYIRFKKVRTQSYWFYVKAILVILGTVAAYTAIFFGSLIENMFIAIPAKSAIVPVHEIWAIVTTVIFSFLAICYFIRWIHLDSNDATPLHSRPLLKKIWGILCLVSKHTIDTNVSFIFAAMGLASIAVTGALGGAIVYGTAFDPFITFVYRLFF